MPNSFFTSLVYAVLGLFLVSWGRKAYFHPSETLTRWHSYLPVKDWSRKLLRSFSVAWVFGGILVILSAVVPYIQRFTGISLVLVFIGVAMAGTFFLLRTQKTARS